MIDKCSSNVLLNVSITPISGVHILTYMMYFTSLVKILLPVMDLNMAYKTQITFQNTRNSDLPKNRDIWFSRDTSRSSAPYAPFFPLHTLILYNYRPQEPQPPSPALHTNQTTAVWTPTTPTTPPICGAIYSKSPSCSSPQQYQLSCVAHLLLLLLSLLLILFVVRSFA